MGLILVCVPPSGALEKEREEGTWMFLLTEELRMEFFLPPRKEAKTFFSRQPRALLSVEDVCADEIGVCTDRLSAWLSPSPATAPAHTWPGPGRQRLWQLDFLLLKFPNTWVSGPS